MGQSHSGARAAAGPEWYLYGDRRRAIYRLQRPPIHAMRPGRTARNAPDRHLDDAFHTRRRAGALELEHHVGMGLPRDSNDGCEARQAGEGGGCASYGFTEEPVSGGRTEPGNRGPAAALPAGKWWLTVRSRNDGCRLGRRKGERPGLSRFARLEDQVGGIAKGAVANRNGPEDSLHAVPTAPFGRGSERAERSRDQRERSFPNMR